MADPGFDAFIGVTSTTLFRQATGNATAGSLLWGDGVRLLGGRQGGRVEVRARGRTRKGWIDARALDGGQSLLEVYFIDVGQGDGVLIKTPDFRHLMIDGGHPRRQQNTGKSAADFVDWKFYQDYGMNRVELDAMIASHCDFDHYGGLADLIDAAQESELDVSGVTVEAFYHAGIGWWTNASGSGRTLGATRKSGGRTHQIQLLGDRAAAVAASNPAVAPRLQGEWGNFIEKVLAAKRRDGTPTEIARLSQLSGHLPGFAPGGDGPSIEVLGPVEVDIGGTPALRRLGSDSLTTNGNSVVLRLDYGRARILLTGDLNKVAQQGLLEAHAGRRLAFQCDVAKACHHGSEDVSFTFLQAMSPAATVISSGDAEGHDHPRPRIVAASGATGYLTLDGDEVVTPLVYSTELARSISLGRPTGVTIDRAAPDGSSALTLGGRDLQRVTVQYEETKPGELNPRKRSRRLAGGRIVAGLVYGLVNVRTDGHRILTATMNEGDGSWTAKTFSSRF